MCYLLFFSLLSILLTKIFYLVLIFVFRPHRKIHFLLTFFFQTKDQKKEIENYFVGHALYNIPFLPIEKKKEFRANDSCSLQNREFIFASKFQ